jgi:hypothetical protein
VIEENAFAIPNVKAPVDKPNPKMGVCWAEWSRDSRYICTRNGKIQVYFSS